MHAPREAIFGIKDILNGAANFIVFLENFLSKKVFHVPKRKVSNSHNFRKELQIFAQPKTFFDSRAFKIFLCAALAYLGLYLHILFET